MGLSALLFLLLSLNPADTTSPFLEAVNKAEQLLAEKDLKGARRMIDRAAERDPKSLRVWELRARWAEASEDKDDLVYALHQQLRLAVAQKMPRKEVRAIRERLETIDPIAPDLLDLKHVFVEKLIPIAKAYEKEGRPHSAIRLHNEILTLDPDRVESEEAIQRIASAPDPSLAKSAKPKDLLADVSDEWIREFNEDHDTWKTKAKHPGNNYVTITDAGYEVMIRSAEAMEQVNRFYRIFFDYGVDGGSVPRIELRIFKNRDEYLKMGSNPPEWSGGLFTGSAVETYIGTGGFDEMIRTLFHEVGHQFVSLAAPGARATTWLNEGLATYFEGCNILANGTVQMNLPANHYLFALTDRMEQGWMENRDDGMDPKEPTKAPAKAPTLEIVMEGKYRWGPPWYAPVWGVTYFFFNYQDPVDGRFVYRDAFREYTDKGGGRVGEGAVRKLEADVLGNPAKPTPGVDTTRTDQPLVLVKSMKELNGIWKDWLTRLRDEQSGRLEASRPYHQWANYAVQRGDMDQAMELFEKGFVEQPDNVEFLTDFARFLAEKLKNSDRAAKLILQAIRVLEFAKEVDEDAIKRADRLLVKWDKKWRSLNRIHEELWAAAKSLAQRYLDAELPMMAMDVSWRFGTELGIPDILPYFEEGVRRSGKSIWLWTLAYNEKNLDGWIKSGNDAFFSEGPILRTELDTYSEDDFNYQFLTMDKVTSGDFSMESEIYAKAGEVTFCGFVFGKKGAQNCQSVVLFPGGSDPRYTGKVIRTGSVDLTTFYGPGSYKIWRHNSVQGTFPGWNTLRVDVSGKIVDIWFNGDLVVTHEFPNTDVLRGGFGLTTGVGKSKFRNIRYLSRPARDPGAMIEREIHMEKLRAETAAAGGGDSLQGSWMGKTPTFPSRVLWLQEPRTSWEEKGPVPTILALWSQEQNDLIPINDWLAYLKNKHADVGLEVVSIASADDEDTIEGYLQAHPFPGTLAVDRFVRKNSYGAAFEMYGVQYFNLPRVLLLDVNHKVVWEGDPGFRIGTSWSSGQESYLDGPLDDLISRRKLRPFHRWSREWRTWGEAALHEGDLERAARLLFESRSFDAGMSTHVKEAQRRLERLETSVDALETMAMTFSRSSCEPALDTLVDWGKFLNKNTDAKTLKALRSSLKGPHAIDWSKALAYVVKAKKAMKPGKEPEVISDLLDKLEPLSGHFPKKLAQDVVFAADAGDAEWVMEVFDGAEGIPSRWLAQEYFKW